MSGLSKYLHEQLGVFLNVKQQKWSWLKTLETVLLRKNFFVWFNILSNGYAIEVFENFLHSPLNFNSTFTIFEDFIYKWLLQRLC